MLDEGAAESMGDSRPFPFPFPPPDPATDPKTSSSRTPAPDPRTEDRLLGLLDEKIDDPSPPPASISSTPRFFAEAAGDATALKTSFLADPGVADFPLEGMGARGLAGESKMDRGVGAGLTLAAEEAVGRVREDSRGRVGVGGT